MAARIPPQNLEAEQSILGGLMLDSAALDSVEDIIEANDFYKPAHQRIFTTIRELHHKNEKADLLTVSNFLESRQELESVGGPAYLATLLEKTLTAANIQSYAKIVREKSILRRLIETSTGIIDKAFTAEYPDIETFVDQAEADIFKIAENKTTQGLIGAWSIVESSIKRIEELYKRKEDITGLASGFNALDSQTAGMHPGELTIIAARPSMGKTAFSLNIASHATLRLKKTVAYFSLEMGKDSVMTRMLAGEAKVGMGELRSGRIRDDSWPRLIAAAGTLSEAPLFIDDTPGISPFEIRARARRLKAQHGLDLIMIDYLQMMSMKQRIESREREVAEISKTLKAIAKELQVPVVALAQLNRAVDSRSDRRPMISDLRESGSIEQDADVIMMLYRDDYYDKDDPEKAGQAEVIIGKQRNGPTGTVRLRFDAKTNRFRDADPEPVQHMPPPQAPPSFPGKPRNFAPNAGS
ncbi:MAG: replicative DNA helicase [Bdellovibrionaceae bacterium]|nr:replicative DNA helicase [Pseudobdellovibrionaceae bacterium]MBX3033685.1 replicative DNA helicase [Pseudobdellovibrionaceae bacterium]